MATGFTITGAVELERKLTSLASNVQKRVVRKAVRAAREPVLRTAKTNASAIVGGSFGALLSRNIVLRAKKKQQRGTYSVEVRTRSESEGAPPEFIHTTKSSRKYYIPAALEYGHGSNKEQAARPFMRPAAKSTEADSRRILERELAGGILREAIQGRYAG